MRIRFAIFLILFLRGSASAQTINYSKFEKSDFDRFKFDVIAKHDNKILVFKATYFGAPFGNGNRAPQTAYANPDVINGSPGMAPTPNNSIQESAIYLYDTSMTLLATKILPLPREISGVHFLVYDDFFYLFYQYQQNHVIYCMAARIGMDGQMIGAPIEMDRTPIVDIHYQSQIYSVIYSENKQHILAFSIEGELHNASIVHSVLFDKELHSLRKSARMLRMGGSEYLSEFQLDNAGNFVFLGLSGSLAKGDERKAVLFTLRPHGDSLTFHYFVPAELFVDDIRLLIDNNRNKYILTSFYSKQPEGDIEGLFTVIRDAAAEKADAVTKTVLSEDLRKSMKTGGSIKKAFNTYYLQDMHLRKDGGFEAEVENLEISPDRQLYTRWNYRQYFSEVVASIFIFFDPYEYDHYYPWNQWRYQGAAYGYSSRQTLVFSCNAAGVLEWVNALGMPQLNRFHSLTGYKSFIANGVIYFLYNVRIRNKSFLTVQTIDAVGQINTDLRFKEDLELIGQNEKFDHFPRLARVVDAGELILPCRSGNHICLVRIGF